MHGQIRPNSVPGPMWVVIHITPNRSSRQRIQLGRFQVLWERQHRQPNHPNQHIRVRPNLLRRRLAQMNRPADIGRPVLVLTTRVDQHRAKLGDFHVRSVARAVVRNGAVRSERHNRPE